MRLGRSPSPNSNRTRVVVLTADAEFDRSVRATFGASSAIELTMVSGRIAERSDKLDVENATVVVVDLDAGSDEEMAALARLMARGHAWQPVAAIDLVRACARVSQSHGGSAEPTEAQIYTFLPAVGGAGVTTLAVQTAMLMLNSGGQRVKPSTCLVDLNFQNGAVAD